MGSDYAKQESVLFFITRGTALLLRMTGNCALERNTQLPFICLHRVV